MIRLVHADGTRPLLDTLASDVAAARRAEGPLAPLAVAVPNAATRAHVEQGLAHALGIAAHLAFPSLRAVVAEAVQASLPGVELAGPEAIAGACLELLHRPEVDRSPDLEPVARYLDAGDPDARDERRVDLATTLGRLFDAYLAHRPEWAAAWRRSAPPPPDAPSDAWSWQGALFRRLVDPERGPLGPREPREPEERRRWLLLDVLDRVETWVLPPRLFLFDVPLRSPVMARVLHRWGAASDIRLYLTNPCLEFWEDVPSRFSPAELAGRLASREAGARGELPEPEALASADPPALRLWGLPAREALRLASELAEWNAEARVDLHADDGPRSLLATFGEDVLFRRPERLTPTPAQFEGDDSLRVLRAPGVRRECEAIAAEIWDRLTARPDLRFSDIVVALGSADADLYRGQLAAAFAEAGDIPHHELDVPLAADSRVIDVVRLLLALPRSGFTRRDLLRILTHPTVRARHGIGEAEAWLAWCDRLGIVHGAGPEDHAETYIEADLFHWDQGLRRLALGAFMAGEAAGRPDPIALAGAPILPTDFAAHELPSAGRLVALVRSLVADARALGAAELPLADWSSWLYELVRSYIGPVTEDDERDLYRVLAAVEDLARVGAGDAPARFRTAARLLEDRLDALTTHRGQPLAEGVVIAPLGAVARLPFEVCFIPGLGEGQFPAPHRPSTLDLRRGARRPGDVTPRMRDEEAFLMRLLTTRDAARLSYVGRDPQTGDALAPASTLAELIGLLERGYVGRESALVTALPLRRLEAPGPSVAARAEADADRLAASLASALPPGTPRPPLEVLEAALPASRFAQLRRRLGLDAAARPPPEPPGRPRVALAHLRRFLEDPFQGWCRQVLGLSSSDLGADPLALVDEPFEPDRLLALDLLRETFLGALGDDADLVERYDRRARRLELGGRLPTGVFGAAARRRHLALLDAWARAARAALEGRAARLGRLELGRASAPGTQSTLLPALELEAGRLTGRTAPVFEDGGCLILLDAPVEGDRARVRHELAAWLAQLVWVASELPAPGPWRAFLADGGPRLHGGRLAPLAAAEARRILEDLTRDLLGGGHVHLLPLATQLALREARAKGRSARRLRDILERAEPDGYGPLEGVRLAPPPLDEALHIVERRLGPFLDAREAAR